MASSSNHHGEARRTDERVITLESGAPARVADCWNRIGVYGSQSCNELSRFIHCRNCPTYSTAGRQLLDQSPPPGYRREWTNHFSGEKQAALTASLSVVIFRISQEWLGLPTDLLQEVSERRRVHSLPHRRKGLVLGLVNIRGELMICVSLGQLLGLEKLPSPEFQRTQHERLLVANWHSSRLVFPVDEVHGAERFLPDQLKAPPATVSGSSLSFAQGILDWQHRPVGVLDPNLLFATISRSLA